MPTTSTTAAAKPGITLKQRPGINAPLSHPRGKPKDEAAEAALQSKPLSLEEYSELESLMEAAQEVELAVLRQAKEVDRCRADLIIAEERLRTLQQQRQDALTALAPFYHRMPRMA